MIRPPAVLALALSTGMALSLTACASGGSASRSAALNGYGSGARLMLHATLRPGTSQDTGSALSQSAITEPGVVFTNWTPTDGLTVGVGDLSQLPTIEAFLHAQPSVTSVTEGPTPTSPPTDAKPTASQQEGGTGAQ